jgi:hypothetical protein
MPVGTRTVLPLVDARGIAAATGMTSNADDLAKLVSVQFRLGPHAGGRGHGVQRAERTVM